MIHTRDEQLKITKRLPFKTLNSKISEHRKQKHKIGIYFSFPG